MMNIESLQFNKHLDDTIFLEKTVIVIDVFRATSVITTALAHNARAIYAVGSVEKAFTLADSTYRDAILGGERNMVKPEGFDFGNSPHEYLDCFDKNIIFTTTNGTAAIEKARLSTVTIAASFLNTKAVAEEIVKNHNNVCLVTSGRHGAFALEDGLCAGKIISLISSQTNAYVDDFSHTLLKLYHSHQNNLSDCLRVSSAYHRLSNKGFQADIEFCSQEDIYSVVPFCDNSDDLIKITNKK